MLFALAHDRCYNIARSSIYTELKNTAYDNEGSTPIHRQKGGIDIQPKESSHSSQETQPEPQEMKSVPVQTQKAKAEDTWGICQQLSINESRIFYIGIQALREQLKQGIWQEILLPTASIVRLFGGNKGYYDQLKKISSRLVKKKILVGQRAYDLYKHIRFNPAQGGLFIMFNPEIRQIAEAMAQSYQLDISLKEVFEFKSRYTVRLLEVFSRYMNQQTQHPAEEGQQSEPSDCLRLAIEVEDLKKLLGIPMSKTYEQITNIRHKVLNIAVEEINASTSYSVSYTTIKEGIRVKAFLFTVTRNHSCSMGA